MAPVIYPTLQFIYNGGASGFFISLKGGAKLSHVDAVLDDGSLLGARFDNPGGHGRGVQIRPPDYERWDIVVRIECRRATAYQTGEWKRFLFDQIGKDYDWSAIAGFAVERDWHDPTKWFCSELATAASEESMLIAPLLLHINHVDPAMCAASHTAAGWTTC